MWSEERVDLLERLWREGLSGSQISFQLGGVSRRAVLGKIWRLGIQRGAITKPPYAPGRDPRPEWLQWEREARRGSALAA